MVEQPFEQPEANPGVTLEPTTTNDKRLSQLAWVVAGVGLSMLLLAVLFAVLRRPAGDLQGQPSWYGDVIFFMAISVSLGVGGFVASRLPRNPYGWLLMAG